VASDDVVSVLGTQIEGTLATFRAVSPERSLERYAPDKWSLREVVGHVIDAERIFAYRALTFARNDRTELPGFDQDPYVAAARSDTRDWRDLLEELELLRRANVLMFRGLDPEAWQRRGVASGNPITVRALAYIIAGHELHHLGVVRAKYLGAGG
jgi:hypothetical protein